MATIRFTEWRQLPVSITELCLETSLRCVDTHARARSCALHGRILSVRQDATHLHYRAGYPVTTSSPLTALASDPSSSKSREADVDEDGTTELVRRYFHLAPNLTRLYEQWSTADANFKQKAPKFIGVRVLRQDPWEALLGFICSSNNNIARISQMVEKLCLHYGPLIGNLGERAYHDVPVPSVLTDPKVEAHLRELGFGYRAKYLHQTAVVVAHARPARWLEGLSNPETSADDGDAKSAVEMPTGGREGYRHAHEQILGLQGVGPKVADCVCLMGLGWGEAVPVDTHVWQIAQRDYRFGRGKNKTLTRATYDAVADHFRQLWGLEAGWAHSVLFAADLRTFSERLRTTVAVDAKAAVAAVKMERPVEGTMAAKEPSSSSRSRKRKVEESMSTTRLDTSDPVRIRSSRRFRARSAEPYLSGHVPPSS